MSHEIEYSSVTGAPRILIQYNPDWDAWADIAEAVWVTALEGGSNYWIDRVDYDSKFSIKSGTDLLKNFEVTVHHNADDWEGDDGEVTKGKSLDIVARGINNLSPEMKMLIMNPYTRDIDAEIADQIVQTGLFGSAVYG
tara:strand:+ start:267 stop:683 length:417 start_codon:yes stop_codon:yes gene_type:complete